MLKNRCKIVLSSFFRKGGILLSAGIVAACGQFGADNLVKECKLNAGQEATFNGAWASRPVPIAVRASDFNSTEKSQIINAINTWNTFFSESKGYELYWAGNGSMNEQDAEKLRPTEVCNAPFASSTGYSNYVTIYKETSWSSGEQVMALTGTCPVEVSGSQFKMLTSASMALNYQYFFVSGKPQPDLESVILHELGHLLGLKHACGPDMGISCDNNEYREAVMYPSLGFGAGRVGLQKRSLSTNDMSRANCLY